jgi:hypothetical protein
VLDEILYQKFLKLWKVRHCFNWFTQKKGKI